MKISMMPDNSVKMIHASQDDEGRKWEFQLYDEQGVLDVSDISDGVFEPYPVFKGGTEQILPENTSTPTTSPILADIVYPDELREEQEFLYRECPSTESGNAKITRIKGNTLKENDTLIPFMGEQIKTTGKNLFNLVFTDQEIDGVTFNVDNGVITVNGTATALIATNLIANNLVFDRDVILNGCPQGGSASGYQLDVNSRSLVDSGNGVLIPKGTIIRNMRIRIASGYTVSNIVFKPMIRLADVQDDTFEPYKESIVNLPTTTYFPDGMKSVGDIYDELSNVKAVKRVGSVDLGTLPFYRTTWGSSGQFYIFRSSLADSALFASNVVANAISAIYSTVSGDNTYTQGNDKTLAITTSGTNAVIGIINNSYTTVEDFKAAMSGQYLYFELAEPVETSITTASLVCEDGEIPLKVNGDVLEGESTLDFTKDSGFKDVKIKLEDEDSVAYSALFKLHVERKP